MEIAGENQVAFNELGHLIIKEKEQKQLHCYNLHAEESESAINQWSVQFPPDVNSASIRSATFGEVLMQDDRTSTLKLSLQPPTLHNNNKEVWESYHHEGVILPSIGQDDGRLYAVKKTNGEYEIIIDGCDIKATLQPVAVQPVAGRPTWKDPYLSVCARPALADWHIDRIAVTSTNCTLDIYCRTGKNIQHAFYHAIVCYGINRTFNGNHNVHHKDHY